MSDKWPEELAFGGHSNSAWSAEVILEDLENHPSMPPVAPKYPDVNQDEQSAYIHGLLREIERRWRAYPKLVEALKGVIPIVDEGRIGCELDALKEASEL